MTKSSGLIKITRKADSAVVINHRADADDCESKNESKRARRKQEFSLKFSTRASREDVIDLATKNGHGFESLISFSSSATAVSSLGSYVLDYLRRLRLRRRRGGKSYHVQRDDLGDDDDIDDIYRKGEKKLWVMPTSAIASCVQQKEGWMMPYADNEDDDEYMNKMIQLMKPSVVLHARDFDRNVWKKVTIVDVLKAQTVREEVMNAIVGINEDDTDACMKEVSFEGVVSMRVSSKSRSNRIREMEKLVDLAVSFVVLEEEENDDDDDDDEFNSKERQSKMMDTPQRPIPGQKIATLSSPFGVLSPGIFSRLLNRGCISSDLVSNRITTSMNTQSAVSVVDLSIAMKPGAEGSPIFIDYDDRDFETACGILLAPLALAKERDGGSSRGAFPLMVHAKFIFGDYYSTSTEDGRKESNAAFQAIEAVCRIDILEGAHFGSGILISSNNDNRDDSGIVLTNRHVVLPVMSNNNDNNKNKNNNKNRKAIMLNFSNGTVRSGEVLKISRGPLDLALVEVLPLKKGGGNGKLPISLSITKKQSPSIGDEVFVVAHDDRFFGNTGVKKSRAQQQQRRTIKTSPEVNFGFVSKISGKKTMIVTSASVRSGASGGALVDAKSGHLIGIVTSNARLATSDGGATVYPDVNFVVNVSEIDDGRIEELMDAYENDQVVIDAWNLKTANDDNVVETRRSRL